MENNKQSSVEWLVDELLDGKPLMPSLIEQAEAMHKEEVIDACNAGLSGVPRSAKQYYEQTFGGNNETV